jgi:hypothetical protein
LRARHVVVPGLGWE